MKQNAASMIHIIPLMTTRMRKTMAAVKGSIIISKATTTGTTTTKGTAIHSGASLTKLMMKMKTKRRIIKTTGATLTRTRQEIQKSLQEVTAGLCLAEA